MTNIIIMFVLAGVLLTVGVLIGSGLHTRAIDRRYRRVAQLVRELRDREDILAEREEGIAASGYSRTVYQEYPTGASWR